MTGSAAESGGVPEKELGGSDDTGFGDPPVVQSRGLKRNALGLGGNIIIAIACAAPTGSIALTLAAVVAVAGYASPLVIFLSAIPMLGIALAYRRLNMWHVNSGGPYIWTGRAISPYFGFMVGWIIFITYLFGAVSIVLPVGTYTLGLFGIATAGYAAALVDTAALVFVTAVTYVGIKASARVSWVLIIIQYLAVGILTVMSLVAVFGGRAGSVSFEWNWFSWSSLGGASGLIGAALISVYLYSGWDTSVLLSEETEKAKTNPGNAVVISVITLAFLYSLLTFAFQAAVTPTELQENADNALVYIADQISGGAWLGRWLVVAVILSGVGSAIACFVASSRVAFAMGYDRVLPAAFGRTHERHGTPYVATFFAAAFCFVALWVYHLNSGGASLFETLLGSVSLLVALFYAATGIAMAVYYRRLAVRGPRNLLEFFFFPVASALFLLYVAYRAVGDLGGWMSLNMVYLYVTAGVGVVLMIYIKLSGKSDYFALQREAFTPPQSPPHQG